MAVSSSALFVHDSLNPLNLPPNFNKSYLLIQPKPRRINQLRCSSANGSPSNPHPETPQDDKVDNLGVRAALAMLNFYKREISPVIPRSCRYVPTCSEYSMEAYRKYGVVKGSVLTAWRLCRCNPLGGYGYDPPRWFGEIKLEDGGYDDEDDQIE